MSYFKLARRVARFRAPGLAILLTSLVAACDADDPVSSDFTSLSEPAPEMAAVATPFTISGLSARSGKTYQQVSGGIAGGAVQYTDRPYVFTSSVPEELKRGVFIRTANDDKDSNAGSGSFLSFTVSVPATVYLLHEDRLARPRWLTSSFQDTKLDVSRTDNGIRFSVFKRSVPQGKVTLGSNVESAKGLNMYSVVVVPADGSTPPGGDPPGEDPPGEDPPGEDPPGGEEPPPPPNAPKSGWFVAPNGSSGGSGSLSSPWTLSYALSGAGGRIDPGDTVWVRGGNYSGVGSSNLSGQPGEPIVIRAYPGERATIPTGLEVRGSDIWFWGLEHAGNRGGSIGVDIRAPRVKLINCVVHGAGMSGVGSWSEAPDQEITGCLIYDNGTHNNLDHGIYTQNSSGSKLFRDTFIWGSCAYGVHAYAESANKLNNLNLDGVVSFQNGRCAGAPDFFFGSGSSVIKGLKITNSGSFAAGGKRGAVIGSSMYSMQHQDVTLRNDYFVGSPPIEIYRFSRVDSSGVVKATSSGPTRVLVRPNPYEAGRAMVAVWQWSGSTANVDLSKVLRSGQAYEIRRAKNFYGAPVKTGTYAGGSVAVPLAGTFDAFVVIGR